MENMTKDLSGGSYLVLKSNPMVPGYKPLICIGYKYNAWKFLYFIVTGDAGIIKAGTNYLSKYPDPFYSFSI